MAAKKPTRQTTRKGRGPKRPATLPATIPPDRLPQHLPERVRTALQPCTVSERKFVLAYVGEARGNGALAVQLAKLTKTTQHVTTRSARANQFLQVPHVRRAIDVWFETFGITAAQLTAALADLASAHLGPFVTWDPVTKGLKVEVPDAQTWEAHRHWLKSVKVDKKTGMVTDIELHDTVSPKRELAKILKLYSDAPIMNAHFHYHQMTDAELLAEWDEVQRIRQLEAAGEVQPVDAVEVTRHGPEGSDDAPRE